MADTPDVLQIKKELLPYRCSILLAGELFDLKFDYNATAQLFTVDLYREGVLICAGEPIIYGVPLWRDVYKSDSFPALNIIPKDPSGEASAVTFDNLGETVMLIVENDSSENAGGGNASGSSAGGTTGRPSGGGSTGGTNNGTNSGCDCEEIEYLTAEELEALLK